MKNLRQHVREFIPMAALIVLCLLVIVPTAQANTTNNGSTTTITATQHTDAQPAAAADAPDGTKAARAKPKAATKPARKSVLDEEVLDSPISYLRNAFSSQEDGADAMPSSSHVMVTVKALVATLLSTIL